MYNLADARVPGVSLYAVDELHMYPDAVETLRAWSMEGVQLIGTT